MGALGKGTGRRLKAEDRRNQIIDEASVLISERGYWGISIRDIALRCGITDTAILHHFGNKENLLLAIIEKRDEDDRLAFAAYLGVKRDALYEQIPSFAVETICQALVHRNASQPEIVRLYTLLSAEALQPNHPVHAYFVAREQRVIDTFAAARCHLKMDPLARGRLLLSLMDGVQLRWLRDLDNIDLIAEWNAAAGIVLGHE
ncbi:TetR/AcrR family transcriptional regulator [Martelella alba]|uniref:TetR/AcrR family transcriptional regulator n=1 Tax=Martelella alba TaxID=2590451 RepID=A0A506U006_9HYPH|nr:TetR/AcrR family transcriptional regulator [Martelella alba]TPW27663.1 TetR/AcrR family transcriptional regulator [Martelella alba]